MARPPSQRDDPESTPVQSSARPGSSQTQGQSPVRSRPPHDVSQTKSPSRPLVPASDAHRNAIEAVTYTSSSHRPRNEATEPFARRSPLRRYSDLYDSSAVQVSSDVDAGDDTHREHHGTVQPSASIRHNLNQQPQTLKRTSHDPYSQNRVENQSANLPHGHRTSPDRRLRHELQPPDRHKGPSRSPGRRAQSPQRRHSQSPARRQRSRSPPMRRSQSPSRRQQNRSPPLRRSPRLASRHIKSPERRGRSPPPTHRPILSDRYNRSRERRSRSRSPTRTRSTPHGAYGSPERHHQSPVSTRSRSIRHESDRGPILEHRNPNPLVFLDDEDLRQSLIRHNQSNNPHYRSQMERGMRSPVQARRSPRLSKQHEPLSHERGSERDRDRDPWERRGETSAGVSRVSSHRQALTAANTVLAGHGHQTQRETVGERHSHEVLQRSPAYRGSNQARIPVGKQTSTNNSQVEHLGENVDGTARRDGENDESTRDRQAQAPSDRSRKRVRSPLCMDPENRTQAMVRDQESRELQNVGRHRSKSPPFSVDGRDSHGENQASRSKRRRGDNSDTLLLGNVLASPEKVHTNSHDNGHNRIQHHEKNEAAADTIQSKQTPKTSSSKGDPRTSPGQEKTRVAEQLRKSSSSFSHQLVENTENPNEGPQNQKNDKQAPNMQRQQPLQISLRKWVSPSSDRQQIPISTPGYQNSQHVAGARHGLDIVPAPDKLRQEALMVLSNMVQRGSRSKETQKITAFNPTSNKHDGDDSRHGHEKTPDVSGSTGNQKKRTHPLSPPKPSGTSPIPGKSTPVSKPHYESSQLVAGGRHDNESIRRISYPHKQPPGTYQVLSPPLPPKPTHVPSTFQKSRLSSQPSHASTQNKEERSLPLHISRERTDKVSPCMQTGTPSAHGQQTPALNTSHESAQLRQQKLSVLPALVAEPSHTQDVDLNPPKRRQLVKHSAWQPQASHSKTSSASKQIAVDGDGSSKAILQGTQGKESKTISAKSTRALNSTPKQGKIKEGATGTQAQEAKGIGKSKKATKVSAKNERKSFIQILKANGAIPKKKRTEVARKGITKGKLKGRTQAQGIRLEEGKSTKMVADNATNVRKPPATMKLNINPACDDSKGFEGVAIQKDGIRASKTITEENKQSGKSDVRSLPMQKSSPSKKRDSTIKAKGPSRNLQRAEESFYKKVTIGKYIPIDMFFVKRDCPDDAAGWSTDVPATGHPIYDVGNQTVKEFVSSREETQNTKIITTINAAGQDIYVLQDENSRRVELESKFNNSPADMPKDGDGDGDRDGGGDAAGSRDGDSQNEAFYHADRDGDGGGDAAGTRADDSQNEAFYHADRDIVNTIAVETFVAAGDIDQYASNYQLFREDFKLNLLDAEVQEDESDAIIDIGTESDEIGVLGSQAPVDSYESLRESAEMGKANNNDADNNKNAHDDDDDSDSDSDSHSHSHSGSDDGNDDSNSDDSNDNTDYSNNDDDSHDSDDDDVEKTKHTMEEVEMRQDPETVLVKSIVADEDEIVDIEEAKEENPINVAAAITTPLPPPPPPLLPKTLQAQQVENVEQSTKTKRGNVLGAENAIDVAATIPTPLPPQLQLPKPLQARPVANVGQSANMKGGNVARAKNAANTATTAVTRPLQSDQNANVGQNACEAAATTTRSLQSDQNANAREGGSTSIANGGGAAGGAGTKPVQADELKEAVKRGVEVYHALKAARREQERNAFRKQLEDTERKAAHEKLRC